MVAMAYIRHNSTKLAYMVSTLRLLYNLSTLQSLHIVAKDSFQALNNNTELIIIST